MSISQLLLTIIKQPHTRLRRGQLRLEACGLVSITATGTLAARPEHPEEINLGCRFRDSSGPY